MRPLFNIAFRVHYADADVVNGLSCVLLWCDWAVCCPSLFCGMSYRCDRVPCSVEEAVTDCAGSVRENIRLRRACRQAVAFLVDPIVHP